MSTSSHLRLTSQLMGFALAASLIPGCSGGSSGSGSAGTGGGSEAQLLRVEYGRLVDIYAFRRVDPSKGDRRDSANRSPVLIQKEVVIDASIESQPLFDSVGEENTTADFRFLPFDAGTGHEELLVLWDDRFEESRFEQALARAQTNLFEIAASYREQNIQSRPIPVVPRNAALVLTFSQELDADLSFFAANPAAIQLLELRGDPNVMPPPDALFTLPFRILPRGRKLVLDTTILGNESQSTGNTTGGLPVSHDNITANIRVAIPSRGGVSSSLRVGEDRILQLNGLDSQGRKSVIRDFRSGNQKDGRVGALIDVEAPMIVGDFEMGIIDIDPVEKIITLNKRFNAVPIRGRMPYVDGAIDGATGLPLGPGEVATAIPLRSGDILTQDVISSATGEVVRLRAEVLQNFSVGTVKGDPDLPFLGRARDGTEGELDTIVRVRVANLNGVDSAGNPVSLQSSSLPLGADCHVRVHYYEFVPFASGGGEVSDRSRRAAFLVVDPPPPLLDDNRNPIPPGTKIDPIASVAVRFNEPMDVESVDRLGNFVLTNSTIDGDNVGTLIREDKPAALSILDTRLLDLEGDGTLLSLSPRLGHFHRGPHDGMPGTAEQYWFHMMLGDDSPTDLAQNPLNLFDVRLRPSASFSVGYSLDEDSLDNFVGSRVFRFQSPDEDGTAPGNLDMFGQFFLQGGSLVAAPTSRFSMTADGQNLGGILRHTRGECFSPTSQMTIAPTGHPGALYQTPSMVGTSTLPAGGVFGTDGSTGAVLEPHQPRGSRLQMTYREEDFGLSQADPNQFMLDIEQMYWAPFNDSPVFFDRFDRYSLSLGHADKRPDLRFFFTQGTDTTSESCNLDCASLNSGLSTSFNSNFLQGTKPVKVLKDKPYEINPNAAFRAASGVKYMPYPEFDRSYTWRDQRLVSWDTSVKQPVGLGGAQEPKGLFPNQDTTAFADSPWGPDGRPDLFDQNIFAVDEGDFWGNRTRDHGPIALPLLMDFEVFPDDGAFPVAQGVNAFHIALVGPGPLVPGGYYNSLPEPLCNIPYPLFRIHTSGGFDPNTGQDILVNPEPVQTATGAWIKDAGLGDPTFGLFNAPSGEGHLHWAQADFVRKVSMVTFGFFDSLLPNQHGLADLDPPFPSEWTGLSDPGGFPNFMGLEEELGRRLRIADLVTSMDPPLEAQPAGTSVVLEFRGVENIIGEDEEPPRLYDAGMDDRVKFRGNLLNPNYAADAFRYGKANAGDAGDTPRVKVEDMTPYAPEDQMDPIRDRFGLLPRYVNFRIIFENNVDTSPATNPALKGLAISFRMRIAN